MKNSENNRFFNLVLPTFFVLSAFFWKLYFIEERDICMDEPFSIYHAQMSLADIINVSLQGEPTPPLFMILLHFWIKVFGLEAFSVRFLPLFFNALTVPFIYLTGKKFFSLSSGILAAGMFILSTEHFYQGLEARAYSLKILETSAALFFYLNYIKDTKSRKALLGLVISNTLLVYTHYFGWFVVAMQFITNLLYTHGFKSLWRFYKPQIFTLIAFGPMMVVLIQQYLLSTKAGTYVDTPQLFSYINVLYSFLNYKTIFWLLIVLLAVGILYKSIRFMRGDRQPFNKHLITLLFWGIIPYTLMFMISFKVPMFNNKYTLFTTIGLYLFIAALLDFIFQQHKIIVPLIGCILLIGMYIELRILPESLGNRELKKSVEYVKHVKKEGDIIIIYPKWSELQFAYHYDRKIFQEKDVYNALKKQDVFRVWNKLNTSWFIKAHPNRRVIYVQDGLIGNPQEEIFSYLDSAFRRVDSVFFPATIRVGVFEPEVK